MTLRGPRAPRRRRAPRNLGIVRDGAVAVRDGRIVAVGRTSALRSRFRARSTLDAEGSAVLPGFVDAHTHLPFAGTREFELPMKLAGRSYLQILRTGGGIHYTVQETRKAAQADLVRLMLPRLATMLAWGTTTAEAKSGYGLSLAGELRQLRALQDVERRQPVELVRTLLAAHVVPREYARDRRAYVDLVVQRILPRVVDAGLAEYCDAFLERGAFTLTECRRILSRARQMGLMTRLHADEFSNRGGAQLAARLGCASAEHLLHVSPAGIRALGGSPTIALLLPGVSVTGLLGRFAPARRLIDAGAAVALGSDFNPNCHVATMPTIIQWACYHLRMTPAEAITAATFNAACAVGRSDRVGSIEVGKQADLVVLRTPSHLDVVYRVGENPVRQVVKAGRLVRT